MEEHQGYCHVRHEIATQSWKGCTEKEEQAEEWREMGKPTVHENTVGWMRKWDRWKR